MPTHSPTIDYRAHPELYCIGRGEQGVLIVQPYKSELLPLWRYKDVPSAQQAIQAIQAKYQEYRSNKDFVGMDMARKYLQMGYTRARRYAMHAGGRKYAPDGSPLPYTLSDPRKADVAILYRSAWRSVMDDPVYLTLRAAHRTSLPAADASVARN